MSNLKKLLCVVLALAMAMSIIIIPTASAASDPTSINGYSDAGDVETGYKEAVDVLTAIGMLKGSDDDAGGRKFGPQRTFTRAEAAKIMAYYMLGRNAEALPFPASAPFADVDANHWAAPFIAYCVNAGILVGVGDNLYKPNGEVTLAQLLKMLLVATGFGQRGEFVGDSWALNVLSLARAKGYIAATDTIDFMGPAQRQIVAWYVFKLLTEARLVTYNALYQDYIAINNPNATTGSDNPLYQAERVFNLIPLYQGQLDAYGVPGHKWRQDNRTITDYYANGVVIADFTVGTSLTPADLYNRYQWNFLGTDNYAGFATYGFGAGTRLVYSHNGYTGTAMQYNEAGLNAFVDKTKNGMFDVAFDNYDAHITLYDLDKNGTVDFLVRKDNFLAKVTAISYGTATVSAYIGAVNSGAATAATTGSIANVKDVAVGDYIWINAQLMDYTTSASTWYKTVSGSTSVGNILGYGKVDIVESQIQSYGYGGRGFNLADGKLYWTAAPAYAPTAPAANPTMNTDASFFVSPNGYLLGYDATSISNIDRNYALIVDLDLSGVQGGTSNSSARDVAKALAFFTDGSYKWVDLKVSSAYDVTGLPKAVANTFTAFVGTNGYLNIRKIGDAPHTGAYSTDYGNMITEYVTGTANGKWYAYTTDANGVYSFTAINFGTANTANTPSYVNTATTTGDLKFVTSNNRITASVSKYNATISATSTTKFILVSNGSATTRTGYTNFILPNSSANNVYTYYATNGFKSLIVPADDGKTIAGIYVIDTTNSGVGVIAKKYGVIIADSGYEQEYQYTRQYNFYHYDATQGKYVTEMKEFSKLTISGLVIVELDNDDDASYASVATGVITYVGGDYLMIRDSADGQLYYLPITVANQTLAAVPGAFGTTTFNENTTGNIFYSASSPREGQVVSYIRDANNVVNTGMPYNICNTPVVVYTAAAPGTSFTNINNVVDNATVATALTTLVNTQGLNNKSINDLLTTPPAGVSVIDSIKATIASALVAAGGTFDVLAQDGGSYAITATTNTDAVDVYAAGSSTPMGPTDKFVAKTTYTVVLTISDTAAPAYSNVKVALTFATPADFPPPELAVGYDYGEWVAVKASMVSMVPDAIKAISDNIPAGAHLIIAGAYGQTPLNIASNGIAGYSEKSTLASVSAAGDWFRITVATGTYGSATPYDWIVIIPKA